MLLYENALAALVLRGLFYGRYFALMCDRCSFLKAALCFAQVINNKNSAFVRRTFDGSIKKLSHKSLRHSALRRHLGGYVHCRVGRGMA